MPQRLPSVIAVVLLTIAWCGVSALDAQSRQQLSVDGTFDLRLASNGDVSILVAQDARTGVAVFRSVNGRPFEPVEFVSSDDPLGRRVYGVWATTRGFFAFQHAGRSAMPRLSRSIDGARWDIIDSSAFDVPADIHDLVQVANGDLLAVGLLRARSQPATGPFQGAMWRSHDGLSWERLSLDAVGLAGATSFNSVALQGTRLVVTGSRDGSFRWRSDDSGASWTLIGPTGELPVVAAVGGHFLGFEVPLPLKAPDFTYGTSSDGQEWQRRRATGLIEDGLSLFPPYAVVRTPGGVFLTGGAQLDLWRRLDWCYTAPTACTRGSGVLIVLYSATGDSWQRINVESLLGPDIKRFAVAETKSGTVIAGARQGAVEITTIPSSAWPFITSEAIPMPVGLPPVVPAGGTLEPGRIYRFPLNAHCGVQWLGRFNGRTWKLQRQLVDLPPRLNTLDIPRINDTLLGTVTLTSADTIEYAIEGLGVVAIYAPTVEVPPLCI